jgi:hypothetical protein
MYKVTRVTPLSSRDYKSKLRKDRQARLKQQLEAGEITLTDVVDMNTRIREAATARTLAMLTPKLVGRRPDVDTGTGNTDTKNNL